MKIPGLSLYRAVLNCIRGGRRPVGLILVLIVLSGCQALPASGPNAHVVVHQASYVHRAPQTGSPYLLVQLSPDVVSTLKPDVKRGLGSMGSRAPAPQVMLGVGDLVSVTIYEAAAGGLFIPDPGSTRPGNFVQLPDQIVDNSGNITIPYAGSIRVAGRGIPEVQQEIVSRLEDRAIEPQVVITLKEQRASQVSVIGEVNSPARFAITPSGDRILDAVARAGGPKHPAYQSYITLQRNGREATERLSNLVSHPTDNIYVRPGDTIVVSNKPETFIALGASGQNGQIPFESEWLTMSEALGKAQGFVDARADPSHVFIYRLEDNETLRRLGIPAADVPGGVTPTVYAANLRDPSGYFLASAFYVRDKDVIYATNAAAADVTKVFNLIRGATGAVDDVKSF